MTDSRTATIQLNIWIITAITAPIIVFANGDWGGTLFWGTGISLLTCCVMRYGCHWDGIVYNIVQCIWLCIVLSQILPYSADCWPTGEQTFPVVPLTLLALAAVSALKGCKATASGISVLFWITSALIGIVLVAGVQEMHSVYLAPNQRDINTSLLLAFLLPAASSFIYYSKNGEVSTAPVVALGVMVSIWISGILSPEIAQIEHWPFYEAAKSVQLFNVAKRLESLVSTGVTVGNYALYSLLLCGVRNLGERFQKGRETVLICTGVSAFFMFCNIVIVPEILVVMSAILWLLLPLLGIFRMKGNE